MGYVYKSKKKFGSNANRRINDFMERSGKSSNHKKGKSKKNSKGKKRKFGSNANRRISNFIQKRRMNKVTSSPKPSYTERLRNRDTKKFNKGLDKAVSKGERKRSKEENAYWKNEVKFQKFQKKRRMQEQEEARLKLERGETNW